MADKLHLMSFFHTRRQTQIRTRLRESVAHLQYFDIIFHWSAHKIKEDVLNTFVIANNTMKALSAAVVLLASLSYFVVGHEEEGYGVDVSFPMHHEEWTPLNQERKRIYEEYMQGCRDKYGSKGSRCDQNEKDRIDMTLRQPQSMVNYTSTGFMKIKAPEELRKLLTDHWEKNKDNKKDENWGLVS